MNDGVYYYSSTPLLPPHLPDVKDSALSDTRGIPVGLVDGSASGIAVVITDDGVEETSKLGVVVGGHGVAAEARVLVVNAGPDALVEGQEVLIAEGLALLTVEVGNKVLAAPVVGLHTRVSIDWKTESL